MTHCVYEPSDFYQALSAVVNSAFTPKEKAKDRHFNFLYRLLWAKRPRRRSCRRSRR